MAKKSNKRRPAKKVPKRRAPRRAGFLGWLLFWPYLAVAHLVKGWPFLLRAPVKLAALGGAMGFFLLVILAVFYGFRALPFDLVEVRKMPERTTVLDRTGKEIARLHGENRKIVPLSKIAPEFEDALLAREDSRFRSHFGVDPFGVARSILQNIKRRSLAQGSSTLTMQLARNTFNLQNPYLLKAKVHPALVELDRKFLEIAVTFRIEARYSKDEILEAYVNRIFWGHSYQGIEAAAQNYFGKSAAELTLSESAMLAGIIRGPNAFTPHRYPERAKRERDTTLDSMVREKFLTTEEAAKAKLEPLKIRETSSVKAGWSLNVIERELNTILARQNLKQGGLTVTTTLDSVLQTVAEEAVETHLRSVEARPGYRHPTRAAWQRNPTSTPNYLQAAVVMLDTRSGAVRSIVGGRDVRESSYDRAQWASRSAGSLFKPFVYLAAYEAGMLPETWVADTPMGRGEVDGATAGWPANADGKYYERMRSADGLILSRNAASVRVGNFAGMNKVIDISRAAGLLREPVRDATLYLGNSPASPWELAAAFTTFPNQGSRVLPYLIEKIQDAKGRVLYEASPLKAIVSRPETAGLVHNLLREVTTTGTAASLRGTHAYSLPAAGKTGTTNDYHDAWYAGYTSSLTACVWVGLDKPATIIDGGYGGSLALPIWATIFRKAATLREDDGRARYPAGDLDPRLTYETVRLCRLSGKRVTRGCEATGTAYQDKVPRALVPASNDFCTVHPLRALQAPSQNEPPTKREAPLLVRPQRPPPRALPVPDETILQALPTEPKAPVLVRPQVSLPRALPVPDDDDDEPLRALPIE